MTWERVEVEDRTAKFDLTMALADESDGLRGRLNYKPLVTGAAVVLARAGADADSDYLIEVFNRQRISTIDFVPAALALFLENPKVGTCRSLKRVLFGGEALAADLVANFNERLPHAQLYNGYGSTEATVFATTRRCRSEDKTRTVPIGRPVANTQLYILDRAMRLAPIGMAGEPHIGGVQLARGCLSRPELTAEKFVPSPFGPSSTVSGILF